VKDTGDNTDKQDESASWTTTGSIYEGLDEQVTTKNSFCIMIGAFIRKNAVSPKTINLFEYQMLLNAYKAAFNYLGGGNQIYRVKEGENLIKKAIE
jgi:hypothetical protein